MTNTSFTQKILQVTLGLGNNIDPKTKAVAPRTFASTGTNTFISNSLRVSCAVEKSGHPSKNKCKIRIYGMTQQDMMTLATLPGSQFTPNAVHKNYLMVQAGNSLDQLTVVFTGEITEATAKFTSPPNLFLDIEAMSGFYWAIAPSNSLSVQGSMAVATMMQTLAAQMGYGFQNFGVNSSIHNPYLWGSPYNQASLLAKAANIEFCIDDGTPPSVGTLKIAPLAHPFQQPGSYASAPVVSAATGMHEFPVFDKKGLSVTTLFNPAIRFNEFILVQSVLGFPISGTWRVHGLKHELESLMLSGGKWESRLECTSPLYTPPSTDTESNVE